MNKLLKMALAVLVGGGAGVALAQEEPAEKSRAEVVAERDAAIRSGEIAAFTGEDSGSFALSQRSAAGSAAPAEEVAATDAAPAHDDHGWLMGEDSGSFRLSQAQGHEPAQMQARAPTH